MSVPDLLGRLCDERDLRQLVLDYARLADGGDVDGFAALFTPDAVLDGGTFRYDGERLAQIPARLAARYSRTYHTVLNCHVEVRGDEAIGETYCLAYHLTPTGGGRANCYVMAITYRDHFRRTAEGWRFALRRHAVEWTEERDVALEARPK